MFITATQGDFKIIMEILLKAFVSVLIISVITGVVVLVKWLGNVLIKDVKDVEKPIVSNSDIDLDNYIKDIENDYNEGRISLNQLSDLRDKHKKANK